MIDQAHLLRLPGPFTFLRLESDDLAHHFRETIRLLPQPHSVYLRNENSTPFACLPVLMSADLLQLQSAADRYLRTEEAVQIRILRRQSFDSRRYNAVWEHYRDLLARISENVTTSSYGRDYPQIFWLFHSMDICRTLKDTPKRVLRQDLQIGRERGDEIKYAVLFKYLDRVFAMLYDLAARLSDETDEFEEELFPALLTQMRDNVLVFTEDYISRDLAELLSYFRGYLKIDGRDLRYRLALLRQWHAQVFAASRDLRTLAQQVFRFTPETSPDEALLRPGYLSYVASRREYNAERLLSPNEVEVWERLLLKLKEFELMHGHRRMVVRIERDGEDLRCHPREAARVGAGSGQDLSLAPSSRPLDFAAPWVVDPEVSRGGLIYDITDFSATVSRIRLSDRRAQEASFISIFRFQRRFDQLAKELRIKWEKYLGDGAFYSGRDPRRLLVAAIEMQRYYDRAVQEGFPFDSGMRIGLNFGEYRLLPFGGTKTSEEARYEVFGHGVVELSRLVTGKTSRELDDIKTTLITIGYSEKAVNEFFAPLVKENLDLVDRREEERRFYAYLNRSGVLINEGIVATSRFISQLDAVCHFEAFFLMHEGERDYVVVDLAQEGSPYLVGLRKLGVASLKGLDRLPVYEVVDGRGWTLNGAQPLAAPDLNAAVDEAYTSLITRS